MIRLLLLLLLPFYISSCSLPTELSDCSPHDVGSNCYYVCPPLSYDENHMKCISGGMTTVSILDDATNSAIASIMDESGVSESFIGYTNDGDGSGWVTDDGSPGVFDRFPKATVIGATTTTTAPPRITTTAGSTIRRTPTSVAVLVDASIYSTTTNSLNMLSFYQSLSQRIGQRGDADFGVTYFGCNSNSCSDMQSSVPFQSTLSSLNQTILNACVRSQPYDFDDAISNTMWCYYSPGASKKPKYSRKAVIIFSSITDARTISSAPSITALPDSVVITVAVGAQAASLSRLSIPSSNALRVADMSDVIGLVNTVDNIIFPPAGSSMFFQRAPGNFATAERQCAVINSADQQWAKESCDDKRAIVCAGSSVPLIPTPNAPAPPSDKTCSQDEATYFQDLDNDLCYMVSQGLMNFTDMSVACLKLATPPRHPWQPVSIFSGLEMSKVAALVDNFPGEGMFWLGLSRDENNNWTWSNGSTLAASGAFSLWREGYPKSCDGCDCVAYVINDNKWINTDCSKLLRPICTQSAQ